MMPSIRISSQQLVCLLAVYTQIAAVLFLPASMAHEAGPDAWLAVLVGITAGTLPVALPLGILARRHPHTGFCQLAEVCLGRWPGKLACLLLLAFSLFICSLVLRNIMDFSAIALLPGTPMLVVGALLVVTIAYAAYSGAEVIARLAALVLVLCLVSFVAMGLGLVNELQPLRVQPLLGHGLMPVLRAAWPLTGWTAEYIVIAPFVHMVARPQKALPAILWGNGLAAVILTGLVAWCLMVFTPALTLKLTYPTYSLARQVSVGQFLERLELGLLTVWLSGMVVKAATCLWSAIALAGGVLGVKKYYYFAPFLAAAALGLTQIWPSEMAQASFSIHLWSPLTLPFTFGLPLLLLLGSWLRAGAKRGVSA
jgi:spore germination protein KB